MTQSYIQFSNQCVKWVSAVKTDSYCNAVFTDLWRLLSVNYSSNHHPLSAHCYSTADTLMSKECKFWLCFWIWWYSNAGLKHFLRDFSPFSPEWIRCFSIPLFVISSLSLRLHSAFYFSLLKLLGIVAYVFQAVWFMTPTPLCLTSPAQTILASRCE